MKLWGSAYLLRRPAWLEQSSCRCVDAKKWKIIYKLLEVPPRLRELSLNCISGESRQTSLDPSPTVQMPHVSLYTLSWATQLMCGEEVMAVPWASGTTEGLCFYVSREVDIQSGEGPFPAHSVCGREVCVSCRSTHWVSHSIWASFTSASSEDQPRPQAGGATGQSAWLSVGTIWMF